jgi:hypothetical protein
MRGRLDGLRTKTVQLSLLALYVPTYPFLPYLHHLSSCETLYAPE